MITIFNRKTLLTDTSSMEIARVTEILKQNHIEYEVVTKKNQAAFSNMVHANMTASIGGGGAASYNDVNGQTFFTYFVYVRKKDYEKAKKAIN